MQTNETLRVEGYQVVARPQELGDVSHLAGDDVHQNRQNLLNELGFHALASEAKSTGANAAAVSAWCKEQGLEPISEKDYDTWRAYLPTPYWSHPEMRINPEEDLGGEEGPRSRTFADYNYHEKVPVFVLERMKKLNGMFVYEVRTPETNESTDPVWFGHVIWPNDKRDIYELARWGRDADKNFLPDVEAAGKVVAARRFADKFLCLCALFVAVIAGLIGFAYTYPDGHYVWSLLGWFAVTFIASFCVLGSNSDSLIRRIARRRLKKQDPELVMLA